MKLLERYRTLSNVEHPFFLTFYGCVTFSQPCYLITEFAENGDLLTFLQNHNKRVCLIISLILYLCVCACVLCECMRVYVCVCVDGMPFVAKFL